MRKIPSLFRKEVLENQIQQPIGKIICVGPISAFIWALLFFALSVILFLFLWLGAYHPIKNVPGILVPDKGTYYIYASSSGVVEKISAIKGDQLKKGFPLLTLKTDSNASGAAPTQQQQTELLEKQIALQQQTLALQKKQLQRLEKLHQQKVVSEEAVQTQQQVVLNTQTNIIQIQQQIIILQGNQTATVNTPESGCVAAFLVAVGTHIKQNEPLAVMLPKNFKLEAQLFIPSDAMRYICLGQQVRLHYTAYPWQQYGVHHGVIVSVDNVLFEPGDIRHTKHLSSSFYRAIVKPNFPFVASNHEQITLKPGMSLSASLLLPKISLWRWIFHLFA